MNKNFIKLTIVIREMKGDMIKYSKTSIHSTRICTVLDDLSIPNVTKGKQIILDYFNQACGNPGREFARFRELSDFYGFHTRIVVVLGNGDNERWFTFSEFIKLTSFDIVRHFKTMLEE